MFSAVSRCWFFRPAVFYLTNPQFKEKVPMKFIKISVSSIALIALFALFGFGARSAKAQYDHPRYLHALSDLRLMRAYVDHWTPNERVDEEQQHAIDEIDAAIREIKMASIEDGKDLRDHAPIDAHLTWGSRFRKAREAGNAAWHDINEEEDNDYAHGLKRRALDHIEEANHTIDRIVRHLEAMNQ
jgi:hypothetical protein